MTPEDIERLRQQQLFASIPDMSGGSMNLGGMDIGSMMGGGYEQSQSPQSGLPSDIPMIRSREIIGPENQNVAAPPAPAAPTAPTVGGGGNGIEELIRLTNQIYTPSTVDRDRYRGLLDAAPVREEPDWTRKLVASGMGINAKDPAQAIAVMEGTMYAPHIRNMQDWTAKTGPFGNAAQYENTANVNERNLAGNIVTAYTQAERLAEQARQADQKNEVARIVANARAAMAAKYTIREENGRVMAYPPDPRTGPPMDLGPSGLMNEREKLDLLNQGRLNVAVQQGANNLAVQGSRNAGNLATQQSRNAGQLAVETLRNARVTGNGSTRGLLPSQQKDALYNKAQEWVRRNPQDAEFITLNPAQRDFDIEDYSEGLFGSKGMPLDRYDQFVDFLYGSGGMPSATTPSGMPTPPQAPQPQVGAGPTDPSKQYYGGNPQYPVPEGLTLPQGNPNQMKMPAGPAGQAQPQQQARPQAQPQAQAKPQLTIAGEQPQVDPRAQAVTDISQQIAALQAQLAAPAPAPVDPNVATPIDPNDTSITAQRARVNQGLPPAPTSFPSWPGGNTGGGISEQRAQQTAAAAKQHEINAQAARQAQQQQIQAKIAELKAQQLQIIDSMAAPPAPAAAAPAAPASAGPAAAGPAQQQPPMKGFATHKQTGQKIPVISYDGGKTWEKQ